MNQHITIGMSCFPLVRGYFYATKQQRSILYQSMKIPACSYFHVDIFSSYM